MILESVIDRNARGRSRNKFYNRVRADAEVGFGLWCVWGGGGVTDRVQGKPSVC